MAKEKGGHITVEDRIEKQKRLMALEKCLLKGFTSQIELAARFGVTQCQISIDIKEILKFWRSADSHQEMKSKRIAQLEYVVQVASEAFVRSRKDQTEETQHLKMNVCPKCEGRGVTVDKKGWCKICEGDGVVPEEQRTIKVRGQAGDPAFLGVIKSCIWDICRLEGHITPPRGQDAHTVHVNVNSENATVTVNKYLSAPPEVLIQARAAIQRLRDSVMPVEGKIVQREEVKE